MSKCPICSAVFAGHTKTCSKTCGHVLKHHTRGDQIQGVVSGVCVGCGRAFARKGMAARFAKHDALKYCSRACAFRDPERYLRKHRTPEALFRKAERNAVRAIVRGFRRSIMLAARALSKQQRAAAIPIKLCVVCGTAVVRRSRRVCSDACRVASIKASRLRARKNRRRLDGPKRIRERCAKFGVPYERGLGAVTVCGRDRWHCRLCGCSTPRRLRGTYKPNAPEIDHIIPLSIPSSPGHVWANVQCACRACNIAKANKPMGQQRLSLTGAAA